MKDYRNSHPVQIESLETRNLFSAILMQSIAPRLNGDITSITPFGGGLLINTRDALDKLDRIVFINRRGKLTPIYTAPDSDHLVGEYIGSANNRAIFFSHSNGLGEDQSLLASDGTAAGTGTLKSLPSGNWGGLQKYSVVGKYIYFTFNLPSLTLLWRTDGTSRNTTQITSFEDAGIAMGDSSPFFYTSGDGSNDELHPDKSRLLRIDAAGRSTKIAQFEAIRATVSNISPTSSGVYFGVTGDGSSESDRNGLWYYGADNQLIRLLATRSLHKVFVSSNRAYFTVYDNSIEKLYVSDGTIQGTQLLVSLDNPSSGGEGTNEFEPFNGGVIFNGNGKDGTEPWISDGTPQGTRQLADLVPGATSSNPGAFTVIGSYVYFMATLKTPKSTQHYLPTDYVSHLFRCNASGQIKEIESGLNVGVIKSQLNDGSIGVIAQHLEEGYGYYNAKYLYKVNADLSGIRVRVLYDQDQNRKGVGISGYKVVADLNGNGIADSGEPFSISGQDGMAEIGGIDRAGRVRVLVLPTQPGQTLGIVQSQFVTLNPLKMTELRFSVIADTRPITIRGVLYRSTTKAPRRNLNDTPLAHLRVYVDANDNQKLDTGELSTKTDSRGRYVFSSVPVGHYKTEISSSDPWVQYSQESVDAVPGLNDYQDILAFPAHRVSGIIFLDRNANGTFDAGDQRMKGYHTTVIMSIPNSQPSIQTFDIYSDTYGRFQYDVVPPFVGSTFFVFDAVQYEKGYIETPSYVGEKKMTALGKTIVYDALVKR